MSFSNLSLCIFDKIYSKIRNMKFILFLALITFFTHHSDSSRCHLINLGNDSDTEAKHCANCALPRSAGGFSKIIVPKRACFKKAIDSTSIRRHTYCRPPSKIKKFSQPCRSSHYVDQTAKVFHNVTKCLNIKRPDYFFALINRESRFQISAQSYSGASCYGQLTGVAMSDINGRDGKFTAKNVRDIPKSNSTTEQKRACNKVANNWRSANTNGSRKTRAGRCALHNNPYTCMMYAGIYYQKGVKSAKRAIRELSTYIVVTKSGDRYIFPDKKAFDSYLKNPKPYLTKGDIQREKRGNLVKDPEAVAQLIALKNYNGGPHVIELYRSYIDTLKSKIWESRNSKLISYLFKDPGKIATGDFLENFSKYVRINYKNRPHNKQVATFGGNVLKDFASVSRRTGGSSCGELPAQKILRPTPKKPVPM